MLCEKDGVISPVYQKALRLGFGGDTSSLDLLKRNGVEPVIRLQTQSLSLVIEAVRTASVAGFVPEPAIRDFPQDLFAVVELDGIDRLGRRLHVVYEPAATTLRPVL